MKTKKPTPDQKTAVIYARYSSSAQTEQSIEGQLHECYDFAKREGYTVIDEYIDRAISGRTDDRPAFQKMISDAESGKFGAVLVYKLDRFSRDRYDSIVYKHHLREHGVKVVSAMENIGDSPDSVFYEAILEASAQHYSLDLSQKVKRGRKETAMKGNYCGGAYAVGYTSENGKLIINEQEAGVVREVFKMYAEGHKIKSIIESLAERGLRARGKPVSHSLIWHMISNQKYIGILKQGEHITEGGCPALVDKETFDKAQQRREENRKHGARYSAKNEYLLSGKVFCGICGEAMHGSSAYGRHGGLHLYYRCKARAKRKCDKEYENRDALEDEVISATLKYILRPEHMADIAARISVILNSTDNTEDINAIDKRLKAIEKEVKKLFDMAVDLPDIGRTHLYEKMEALDKEKKALELERLKLERSAQEFSTDEIIKFLKSFDFELLDDEVKKKIIRTFVNRIFVYEDKIQIYYNITSEEPIPHEKAIADMNETVRSPSPLTHQRLLSTNRAIVIYGASLCLVVKRT